MSTRPLSSLLLLASCTSAELYTQAGNDPLGPDRVSLFGELCTEDAGSSSFPVKVLLMIDSSAAMFNADPNALRFNAPGFGLEALVTRYRNQRHVRFGFVGIGDSVRPVPPPTPQQFFAADALEVQQALIALETPLGSTRDLVGAVNEAGAFIGNDIANASPGEVLRSRYIVYMLLAGPPGPGVSQDALSSQVEYVRDLVYSQGALEFRLEVGFLYHGELSYTDAPVGYGCAFPGQAGDPACACDPVAFGPPSYCGPYCDVRAGLATEPEAARARASYESMAFVGGGSLREFHCPSNLNYDVGISNPRIKLVKKDIVAYNRNVLLTPEGPVPDSDGDGLADAVELSAPTPTDPTRYDTDGDGIGDAFEYRAQMNPTDPSDRPASCVDPALVTSLPDRDLDLLNDCEEGLLQSSPSIPDTDGDGLPDSLELWSGTVPGTAADRLMDYDGDGVPNASEVTAHTNPRGHDGGQAAQNGYRTRITPLGSRAVPVMEDSDDLRGVSFRAAAPNVVAGPAFLRWDACARTLEWHDAQTAPAFSPVPVTIDTTGIYTLTAEARVLDYTDQDHDGDSTEELLVDSNWIEVFVTLELMPTCDPSGAVIIADPPPLITVATRNCYGVRISNIKLLPTTAVEGESIPGMNHVVVFFTQAPEDRRAAPGIAKVADVRIRMACERDDDMSTCARTPGGALELFDSDFISAVP